MLSRSRSKWAMDAHNKNIYKPLIVHLSEVNKKLNEQKLETIKSDLKGTSPRTCVHRLRHGQERLEAHGDHGEARRDEYKQALTPGGF